MVWGVISVNCPCVLEVIEGNMTGDFYSRYVEHNLPAGTILVQDNARPHIDKKVQEICCIRGIQICCLPPYSPDLNPIEKIWSILSERVYKDKNGSYRIFYSKRQLVSTIKREWSNLVKTKNIIFDTINHLHTTMSNVAVRGGVRCK
jgi:transposase